MITLESIDLSRFNGQIAMLREALIGAGGDGDFATIVKDVGADLAMEISNSLGPKSKKKGEAYVRKDMKSVFFDRPAQVIQEPHRGFGDMLWFMATPKNVLGVEKKNYRTSLSVDGMQSALISERKIFRVGVSSEVARDGAMKFSTAIGNRGKQTIRRVNRIVVQRGQTEELVSRISKTRIGRLRATFAYAAHMLGKTRIQSWIREKFNSVKDDGVAIFDQSKLTGEAPTLSFGGSAPKLIENFEGKVLEAIDRSEYKLFENVSAIIHGYANDWNSAKEITRKANWMKSQ